MEEVFFQMIAYGAGTIAGVILTRYQIAIKQNELLDLLIDQGFLRSKVNNDGNIVLLKYHDNRQNQ
jgi:hypothetical protein